MREFPVVDLTDFQAAPASARRISASGWMKSAGARGFWASRDMEFPSR